MSDADPLTLDQAAAWVGWTGKYRWERMERFLERKERELGRDIMVRTGTAGRRRITRAALRRHAPELFDVSVDEISRGFRRILDGIDSKIDQRLEQHPKIRALERDVKTVARNVNELAKRVRGTV